MKNSSKNGIISFSRIRIGFVAMLALNLMNRKKNMQLDIQAH